MDFEESEKLTIRESSTGLPEGPGFADPKSGRAFRGWPILDQLPTKGAEADIFLVEAFGERRVLKLYRHRLEPKLEILERITEISRRNSRCFVVFLETGFDEETGRWYELQEYMPQGSLREIPAEIRQSSGFVKNLVSELSDAISCLHENGIVHCDMKPANVLVRSLDPLDLVLTDFGISSLLASDMSQRMTSLKGTPMYWAPEAFSRLIGRPCDWWGLGMIVLEILTGEHPLEGMTDSQIIHKLTIGGVEIPDSVDTDWGLLVKGLLTKDDSLRWDGGDVALWLSGERDIPIHYEAPRSLTPTPDERPFKFENTTCRTREDVAHAFAENEKPWFAPSDYLRFVRQWFESNMSFDEALELGRAIGESDPERALFRFIHISAKRPFSVMGHVIDAGNLQLFLGRHISREASAGEERIVQLLGDGGLLNFYDEYVSIRGDTDRFLPELLRSMKGKDIEGQWNYLDALRKPDQYDWPDDAETDSETNRLASLMAMGAVPIKRDELELILGAHVLPRELVHSLRSVSECGRAIERLKRWSRDGLLFARTSGDDDVCHENKSIREYERTARQHFMGHTRTALERIESLGRLFHTLTPPLDYSSSMLYFNTIDHVGALGKRAITHWDSLFMAKTTRLFEKRARLEGTQMRRFASGGLGGGLLFCMVAPLTSGHAGLFFALTLLLTVFAGGVFYLAFAEGRHFGSRNRYELIIGILFALFFFVVMAIARNTLGFFGRYHIRGAFFLFPFSAGVTWGCLTTYGLGRYALSKNMKDILDACAEYDRRFGQE
jgi:serine/threonine protein kinase